MKRKALLLILMVGVLAGAWARTAVVVNRSEGTPMEGATVFSRSGRIIGITDSAGRINASAAEFPLTATCVGYRADTQQPSADTIFLLPHAVEMPEVEVSAAGRPVTRLLVYAREYYSGASESDTAILCKEYMAELFLAGKDVKGYKSSDKEPRICNRRVLQRLTTAGEEDASDPMGDDAIAEAFFKMMLTIPDEVKPTEAMRTGATTDVVPGKYGPAMYLHRDSNLFSVKVDALSQYKNHHFSPWFLKLLGLTMEVDRFDLALSYRPVADGEPYTPSEFLEGTFSMSINGTGRWIKKAFRTKDPVRLECFVEAWPVDISRLTIEEYKEMRNEANPDADFPDDIYQRYPLPPAPTR